MRYIYGRITRVLFPLACNPVDAIHPLRQLLNNYRDFQHHIVWSQGIRCFIYTKNTPYCFPCLYRSPRWRCESLVSNRFSPII